MLNSLVDKKDIIWISEYFPKPYEDFVGKVNIELDLPNYEKEAVLKGLASVNTNDLAAKLDLASLKAEVNKIDINKLNTVPADLSKFSNIVNIDIAKNTEYDKLVTKVSTIHSSIFLLKTQYNTDKSGLEKKINDAGKKNPDISGLVKKKKICNAKITEIEVKIPSITSLAATFALNTIENKIPNVSDLVNTTDFVAKILDIEAKWITAFDYNKFTGEILDKKRG